GVDYKIDISKPAGQRITEVMYKGKPLAEDTVLKLAINDYRYSGIGPDGSKLISGTPYYESAPKALRTYIKEYIESKGTITPATDNNWEITGNNWDVELRNIAVKAVNDGTIKIPTSADGRTENVKAVTEADLIEAGLHPKYTGYMAVVHTNDTHSRVEESSTEGMGLARVATHIATLRARYGTDSVLALDAGDTLHGIPLITTTKGKAATKIFNLMGYDAMTAGNHDFNYGYERLLELDGMLNFPVISANVVKVDGKELLTPYIIKEVSGKKVGIFGLSTPETAYKTHPDNVKGLDFKDPIQVAKDMVAQLEGQTDMIIALSHLGLDEGSGVTSDQVAKQVNGIDLIVDGHSHTTLTHGKKVNDTMIVQTGEYDKNVGQVNIYIKKDGKFDIVPTLLDKQDAKGLEQKIEIVDLVKTLKTEFDAITAEVVGKTDVKLEGTRELVRAGETNMGNLITNALLYSTGADVALTNGGGIRASIEAGNITKKDVITVLPFGNTGAVIEVTGQEIVDALENGVKDYPKARGAFAHVAGMSYIFDPSKEAGNRVVEVLVGGKVINLTATYKLATNDFIAAGGDEYTMFGDNKVIGEYSALDEIVIKYLQDKGTKDTEVKGRVKVVEPQIQEKIEVLPNAA
ncbi:MAG: 5'-nucleotidase C-terminal domain-containing protein, partial [Cellulosilyticaceae bacterium]